MSKPGAALPVVSVILVNYRGAEDTITCVQTLQKIDWPADKLEIIVVDNKSGDGSVARLREALPKVKIVASDTNSGFAGGCNRGVAESRGEIVAFINNDARPHDQWIRAAVEALQADAAVACVASKVLTWEGTHIDYVDGSLTWYGMGYKREVEKLDEGAWDTPKDVLFGTGAAMFVRADVFRDVGEFDERFFMFFEDVDFGWRLNLLGHRVRYVPTSIAYHKHHASINKFGNFREAYLLERNALMSLYKNLDDASLAKALPAAMALAVRRSFARTDTDTSALDLQRSPGGDHVPDLAVKKMAMTGPFALDFFAGEIASLNETRLELQARRQRTDPQLFKLFREPIEPAYGYPSYLEAHGQLVEAFGLRETFRGKLRVLVVTGEPLEKRLAGPAIRALEIAKALAPDHTVRLLSTHSAHLKGAGFEVASAHGPRLQAHTDWADVIIFQGFLLEGAPWLMEDRRAVLVADIYDPMHLEQLEQARDLGEQGRANAVSDVTAVLNTQLQRADYFLCASDKQRDFWLGQLAGQGRINARTYDADSSLRRLIEVAPFGFPAEPPVQAMHGVRGVVPGIGMDDKVIIWGGGIYNWFDPLTLIRAVAALAAKRPDVRLYFMGTKHPNPGVPAMKIAWETRQLADELGLTGKHVFFNDGWVEYDRRADHLLDADVGVSTHFPHIETAYSFRTRILDYLWAGLPIVATEGDAFEPLIRENGWGHVVPAEDVGALAAALDTLLYNERAATAARKAIAKSASQFHWSTTLAPLVDFVADARRAADAQTRDAAPSSVYLHEPTRPKWSLSRDVGLIRSYLVMGGPREVARRAVGRLRR